MYFVLSDHGSCDGGEKEKDFMFSLKLHIQHFIIMFGRTWGNESSKSSSRDKMQAHLGSHYLQQF